MHPEAPGTRSFARPSTCATPHCDFDRWDWNTLAHRENWPKVQGAKHSEYSTLADALVERVVGNLKIDEQQQTIYIHVERLPTTLSTSSVTAAPYSTLAGALGERGEAKRREDAYPSTATYIAATLSTSPADDHRTTSLPPTQWTTTYDLPIGSTCRGGLEAAEVYATPQSTYASFCDPTGPQPSSTAQPGGYEQPHDGTRTGAVEPFEAFDTPISMALPDDGSGNILSTFSTPQITPAEGWGEVQTGESLAYPCLEIDNQVHGNRGSFVHSEDRAAAYRYNIDAQDTQNLDHVASTHTGLGGTWYNGVDQLYVPEAGQAQDDISYISIRKWTGQPTTSLQQPLYEAEEVHGNRGSFVHSEDRAAAYRYNIDAQDTQNLDHVASTHTGLGGTWYNGVDQLYVPEAGQAQDDISYISIRKWTGQPTTSLQQPLYEAEEYATVTNQSPVWPAQGIGSFSDTHEPYNQLPEFQASTPEMSQSTAPGNTSNELTEHSEQPATGPQGSTSALRQSVAAPSSWGKSTSRRRQYVFRFYRPPQSTAERAAWVAPRHAPAPKQRKRPRKIEGIISIGVRDRAIRERCVFKGVSVDVLDGDSMEGWGRRDDIMLQRDEGGYQPCLLKLKYRQHGQAIRVNLNETNDTIRVRDLARMIARHFGRWCRESDAQRRAVCQQLGHPSDQSGVCECGREPTPMENIILTSIEQRGNHFTGVFVDR
ncbi:hypothetical protein GLOTRDRAFT_133897 [Gloeophyllum trabeum ATCC 11539]|uniref:Uncharacterized protein n=1 Tax=Gloeophyllum trabeum (strain ATCC 11539 / FP-39264 / Madison 617) TaxID=670483 RepID=S7PT25_GLOTA|nr:uncharacterized protein GLOTRDRAFT_133897 [Gloeophyllum trabeum ATCC 11539]EPQ50528.1 hypothetical protein GLOTRDRAFT_133897 [Gloeophyllum trabeum ATCC 11539]